MFTILTKLYVSYQILILIKYINKTNLRLYEVQLLSSTSIININVQDCIDLLHLVFLTQIKQRKLFKLKKKINYYLFI